MTVAAAYLLLVKPELAGAGMVIAAALASSFAAFGFGWMFGTWYLATPEERPGFELLAVPALVLVLSLHTGLMITALGTLLLQPEPEPLLGLALLASAGSLIFMWLTWPVLLPAFALTACWLAKSSLGSSPEIPLTDPPSTEPAMSRLPIKQQMPGLLGWLLVTAVAAAIGGAASMQAGGVYTEMVRPEWAPPGQVFSPVWMVLYALMAIAAWLVWRVDGWRGARTALTLYLVQLVFNALWSWLFFGWRLGGWAFAEILLLWLAIVATLLAFWRIRPLAGALLLPYLAWVSFAAFLNYTVWQLNPQLLG